MSCFGKVRRSSVSLNQGYGSGWGSPQRGQVLCNGVCVARDADQQLKQSRAVSVSFAAHRAGTAPGTQAPSVFVALPVQILFLPHSLSCPLIPSTSALPLHQESKGGGKRDRLLFPLRAQLTWVNMTAAQIHLARLLSQKITPCHKGSWKMKTLFSATPAEQGKKQIWEHFLRDKGRTNTGSQPAVSITASRWWGCNCHPT